MVTRGWTCSWNEEEEGGTHKFMRNLFEKKVIWKANKETARNDKFGFRKMTYEN